MFHVYNIIFLFPYTLQCAHHQNFSIYHPRVDALYPFHPPPLVTTTLSSTSTYFCLVWFIHLSLLLVFYSLHMSETIWYLSFSVWLISLNLIPSRSIHVIPNGKISKDVCIFNFGVCVYIYIYIYIYIYNAILASCFLIHKELQTF